MHLFRLERVKPGLVDLKGTVRQLISISFLGDHNCDWATMATALLPITAGYQLLPDRIFK